MSRRFVLMVTAGLRWDAITHGPLPRFDLPGIPQHVQIVPDTFWLFMYAWIEYRGFNMSTSRQLFLFLSVSILVGCGDPRDKLLPFDLAASTAAQETLAQLTAPEQQAIYEYEVRRAARLAAGDESARKSVTYRQAIADQLVYDMARDQRIAAARVTEQAKQQEANTKAAEASAAAAAKSKLMRESIACRLTDKKFDSVPKPDATLFPLPGISYVFTCSNTSTATVNGFKGKLIVKGPYGELVGVIPLRRDNPLPRGVSYQMHYNGKYVNVGNDMTARTFYDLSVDKFTTEVDLDSFVKADGELIKAGPF